MFRTKWIAISVIAVVAMAGCAVDHEEAVRVLEGAGYSDITTDGRDIWGCSVGFKTTSFTATGPSGRPVRGSLCRGLTTGYIIQPH